MGMYLLFCRFIPHISAAEMYIYVTQRTLNDSPQSEQGSNAGNCPKFLLDELE